MKENLKQLRSNSFQNEKEYRKSEKISDRHRNCHVKVNFRKFE
jgi:hypothetical protein